MHYQAAPTGSNNYRDDQATAYILSIHPDQCVKFHRSVVWRAVCCISHVDSAWSIRHITQRDDLNIVGARRQQIGNLLLQ